jgi:hypothetical protein
MSKRSQGAEWALAVTLGLRAAVNAAFAVWLVTHHLGWIDIFRAGASYAIADGMLGLLTVVLLVPHVPHGAPRLVRATTFADALLRLAAGFALRAFPGLPDFPISAVLFFGVAGVAAGCLGVIALTTSLVGRRHDATESRAERRSEHELFDPFALIGVFALALAGYAFVVGPPATSGDLRVLAVSWSAGLAIAFLAATLGAGKGATLAGN